MDRLTSLNVFVRVADSGGFSAAARRLNMSTTMVSNHVQSLEDRLGARLLNRTTRKVSLTDIGKTYYERCTQILAELEDADRVAGALQSTPRGALRIYANAHTMRFLAPLVADFLSLYQGVTIELLIGQRMIDMIEEGFDLAITITSPPESSLIIRRLATWHHVLCCAPSYLEKHAPPQQPADLANHNCLRYAYYPFEDGWHFIAPDGRTAVARVTGNLLTSAGELLRTVALRGQGLFLAPTFLVGDDLEAERLVPLMTAYRVVEQAFTAIYPHRHHLSAKVRAFIDLLAQRLAEPKWRTQLDADI